MKSFLIVWPHSTPPLRHWGLLLGLLWCTANGYGDEVGSRLRATGGVPTVEGAAGGGMAPWAVIAGYGQEGEWGANGFATHLKLDDFSFAAAGVSLGVSNRIELSYAVQQLDLEALAGQLSLPDDTLRQAVTGAKVRLFNHLIYDPMPQITLGVQHKRNLDFDIPALVGAAHEDDTEFYLAATKLWLAGIGGRPVLWNLSARSTRANQLGLLGFGGPGNDNRQWQLETSVGLLLARGLVAGIEYRQKPNNLTFAAEEDWADAFVAWFPDRHWTFTAAWTRLGSIAGKGDQSGFYLSIQASL